jgi:S-methylmethionine-dependent homocysteine/selenocysteine methylase
MPVRPAVTDGGLETDLIFHKDMDLPYFAAFPLVEAAEGRALLESYFADFAAIAGRAGVPVLLETPTWRASADWGALLGYSAADLARVNEAAVALLAGVGERHASTDVLLGGTLGPRGDGYRPEHLMSAGEAADYHRAQVDAFARAGVDVVTAYTLTDPGEAIGFVRAAREAGVPVAVSFTVETDGRLPTGDTLAHAIATVDEAGGPDYYLVNCAHPAHIGPAMAESGWQERVAGLRCNASTLSHAELDEAAELDEGDPRGLAADLDALRPAFPNLAIVGGCCGTDARHVASMWHVEQPVAV